ncbi:MAG: type IV pilus twitching motility protein PilT [Bradymonadaceae bacterium]
MSDQAKDQLHDILKIGVKKGASDIHLKAGLPPLFRIDGSLRPLREEDRLEADTLQTMAEAIMTDDQKRGFNEHLDYDFSYGVSGVGRFRVNVFQQRKKIGMVFRVIPFRVRSIDELHLPDVVKTLSDKRRGLILCTGITGSGKSTTLAAMLNRINESRTAHIITIEDPIEYVIRDKRSVVNQRELGQDATSYKRALRAALRQDPDVIMVGEMRDYETMEIALTAAETGHLVLSTLHTVDAADAVNRIVTAFPPELRDRARYQFANLFEGVIAQRLLPRADGQGRIPAAEILVSTARTREMIHEKATPGMITEQMAEGVETYGMQVFDQSLMHLLQEGYITYEEAVAHSSNPEDFKLRMKGVDSASRGAEWKQFESNDSDDQPDEQNFDLDNFEMDDV